MVSIFRRSFLSQQSMPMVQCELYVSYQFLIKNYHPQTQQLKQHTFRISLLLCVGNTGLTLLCPRLLSLLRGYKQSVGPGAALSSDGSSRGPVFCTPTGGSGAAFTFSGQSHRGLTFLTGCWPKATLCPLLWDSPTWVVLMHLLKI